MNLYRRTKGIDREAFLNNAEVRDFVNWLTYALPNLSIHLDLKRSRFVPQRIETCVAGIQRLVPLYQWKSKWELNSTTTCSGDWQSTLSSLNGLSTELTNQVDNGNCDETLKVCKEILRWGGNRNFSAGAFPFLQQLPNVANYLTQTRNVLRLDSANLTDVRTVENMNSMLTKVHALNATDGLPIYDSRVAVAAAGLVELYRRARKPDWKKIPSLLLFPSLDPKRTVQKLAPDSLPHGSLASRNTRATLPWTQAKVRLGWLMQALLHREPSFLRGPDLGGESFSGRMHSLEASLFMIGYDIQSLTRNLSPPTRLGC